MNSKSEKTIIPPPEKPIKDPQVEEQLRLRLEDSAQRYRTLFEGAPIALWESDCSALESFISALTTKGVKDFRAFFEQHPRSVAQCIGKIKPIDANKHAAALYKAKSKEEVLAGFARTVSEASIESLREGLIAYAEGRDIFECDILGCAFDGARSNFRLTCWTISGANGKRTKLLCSLVSTGTPHQVSLELQQFKTISDEANFGNAFCDPTGNILYVNKAFAHMHGYEAADLIGKHISMFYPPAQLEAIASFRKMIESKGMHTDWKSQHLRKDGTIFPALLKVTLIKNEEGRPLFVAASAIDLTERKEIEDRLREREKELKEKNITLQEMNAALRVLLQNRDVDKTDLQEKVVTNVKELVFPFLEKLETSGLDARQGAYVEMVEAGLNEVVSPFLHRLSSRYSGLTQSEVMVAKLVKEGKSTKEIATIMGLSKRSVDTYRMRLRKKLGIVNQKINLRTHLISFQQD